MRSIITGFLLSFLAISNSQPTRENLESFYSIENRIAGGVPAYDGQFPFQVGLRTYRVTDNNEEYTTWCGGCLISENAVLTAAHCLGGYKMDVILGVTNLTDENGIVMNVVDKDKMIIHENLHRNDHDIALVLLSQNVQLNDKIQIVNLPRRSQQNLTFERVVGWISGWGILGDGKSSPIQLHYARRWILPHSYCERVYPGYFRGDLQVCVDGSHKTSSCSGDSGGPLTIVEEDGTRTLVGVTSYGMNVCEENYPVVYTRVTPHLDWIAKKTGIIIRE